MKKIILSLLITTSIALSAQIGGSTQIGNSKWTFGGNAGISGGFGSNSGFGISVAPRVGYKISENVEAGISAGFNFLNTDFYSLRNWTLCQLLFREKFLSKRTISGIHYQPKR